MALLNNSHLSASLSEQDMTDLLDALNVIDRLMPFLVELTPKEMKSLAKIDVSNQNFAMETINVLETTAVQLPANMSKEEIKKDLDLYQQLNRLRLRIEQLAKTVKHTTILAGSQAYSSSLVVYKLIQTYANAGISGYAALEDRLKIRFAKQGKTPKAPKMPTKEGDNDATTLKK